MSGDNIAQPTPSDDTATRDLVIESVGARGDGIAAGPVYVPFTLPGEHVRAVVTDTRGELRAVTSPSKDRVAPPCRHFGVCGGCALQHWDHGAYLEWKRAVVSDALARAGVTAEVAPVLDAARSGRRRATFHAVRARAVGFAFGFAQRGSHHVFELEECPVLAPALDAARPGLKRLAETLLPRPGRVDVHATLTDAGLDVAARGGTLSDAPASRALLAALAQEHDWARLIFNNEPAAQTRTPMIDMAGAAVELPPGAFLQATGDGEAALAELVVNAAKGAKLVADLYAGLGSFSLRLARFAAVHAVEGDRSLASALKRAAARAEGLKPISVETRDLARAPLSARELARFDLVALDPPRTGASAQMAQITKSTVRRVAYVSCNPATFARDAKTLADAGFRCATITPVDQFLWSPHIELVGEFSR